MGLLLSTVSANVTINDLKGYTFIHPIVNFQVYDLFTIEDIDESIDFSNALTTGLITLTDDSGTSVTNISNNSAMITAVYDNNNDGKIDDNASQVESVNNKKGIVEALSFIANSGRFYCNTNNRWITDSDDNYGTNYQQFNENCGAGVDPLLEWEHMGLFLPKDTVIKNLNFLARASSLQITDFEIYIVERKPDTQSRYSTGFDNDAEMINTLIYRDMWKNAVTSFAGNMNDRRAAVIPINHTMSDLGMISIYIKPVGTITVTRYITATWTWEIK